MATQTGSNNVYWHNGNKKHDGCENSAFCVLLVVGLMKPQAVPGRALTGY